jgi:hypothetical protein
MSASPLTLPQPRLHIVPRIQAAASLEAAAQELAQRKGPHSLRLLHASEDVALQPHRTPRTVEPGLAFYRKYTEGLLRRYMKMSMENGRVPSLLGRELFRTNVTHYKVRAFDDVVIFCHDVSQCLKQLDPGLRHLIRRIALEEYTQPETAAMLGIHFKTVAYRYADAIDKLTRLFLDRNLLNPLSLEE